MKKYLNVGLRTDCTTTTIAFLNGSRYLGAAQYLDCGHIVPNVTQNVTTWKWQMLPKCCMKAARRTGDIALIVGPVVGGMLFIAVVGLVVFLFMARKGGAQFSAVVRVSLSW